jgi:hypothetical protein
MGERGQMTIRRLRCELETVEEIDPVNAALVMAKVPDARELTPWISRWQIDANRTIYVSAQVPGQPATIIDAREWIETMHDEKRWPSGTIFFAVTQVKE